MSAAASLRRGTGDPPVDRDASCQATGSAWKKPTPLAAAFPQHKPDCSDSIAVARPLPRRYPARMPPWLDAFRLATESVKPLVMALATVDELGSPSARHVICRLIDDVGSLVFTSDARSQKHAHLMRDPRAEAVCWLPPTREQFRFVGEVELIGPRRNEALRARIWSEITAETKATFFWAAPGQLKIDADELFPRVSEERLPPDNFELICLRPSAVEHLELATHPHRRTRWRGETNWSPESLNP